MDKRTGKADKGIKRDEAKEQVDGERIEASEEASHAVNAEGNPGKCPTCGRDR